MRYVRNSVVRSMSAAALLSAGPGFAGKIIVARSGGAHATVQAGLDAAGPGDTVLVRAGVYGERVRFGKGGNAAQGYITLQGEAGAVIDGAAGGSGSEGISIEDRSYVRVVGLEVRNLKGSGTPIGISVSGVGSHVEILGNLVHHVESPNGNAHGIAVYGTSSTPISSLKISGNEIHSCKLGQSESLVLNGNVAGFEVKDNVVHDNDNIGIDFIGFEGTGPSGQDQARNGVCSGNRVYNISSRNNPTYGGEASADGIYVDGGRDIVIESNRVDNCDIGFEIASEHGGKTTSNITLRNNFASRSRQGNIMAGGYASSRGNAAGIVIVNNTTWQGAGGEVVLQHNCDGVVIRNNIFVARSGGSYLENSGSNNRNITVDNNLYFGAGGSPGSWPDARARFADPRLAGAPADLHLLSGSPAIDAGVEGTPGQSGTRDVDGQARVAGARIDLGADESGAPVGLRPAGPKGTKAGAGRIFDAAGRRGAARPIAAFDR